MVASHLDRRRGRRHPVFQLPPLVGISTTDAGEGAGGPDLKPAPELGRMERA
ncbi:MAG: hypothetical protein IT547_08105 [Hyphomonadaceae bacterium]|nr:hypothetical protein [Hyphomonadaceae bacterium]